MTIRKARGKKRGYNLFSKKGRKLNKRPMSKKALRRRERQINYFKSRHRRSKRRGRRR
jgi:hypothetical protein